MASHSHVVLVYWIAMLVGASLDPHLVGPPGGIWFWGGLGMGLAALRCQPAKTVNVASSRPSRVLGGV